MFFGFGFVLGFDLGWEWDWMLRHTVDVPALTAPSAPPLLELVSMGIVVLGLGFGLVVVVCGCCYEIVVQVNFNARSLD
jgi:hypothetical protein